MTNPTTNFGWVMPTSASLVTNLPADFNTFGQAVDTSMAELKGGTTGQVLSKTSATDMDFTWVTTDDANAIQNAIVDAKGDLIAASAADTPARLAVGNNGETLVADSSTSTGLRYQVPVQNNPVINSNFSVFQRGTSISVSASTSPYVADRWQASVQASQACTYSQQVTADTTNLPFIQNCIRVQRNSGQTGTGTINLAQSFESINSRPFAGKTVVLSFYARKGANYSQSGDGLGAYIYTGTGTDQNVITGYTGGAIPVSTSTTLTTTWQRFQGTATLAAGATELGVRFQYDPTGTAGANDYFEVTGIQLELGSIATPYKPIGTFQQELAACQRYYYYFTSAETNRFVGQAISTSAVQATIFYPVTLRGNPTITYPAASGYSAFSALGTSYAGGSIATIAANVYSLSFTLSGVASSLLVAGNASMIQPSSSKTEISAEL